MTAKSGHILATDVQTQRFVPAFRRRRARVKVTVEGSITYSTINGYHYSTTLLLYY